MFNSTIAIWKSIRIFHSAFQEQQEIVTDLLRRSDSLIRTHPGTAAEFTVRLDPPPPHLTDLSRNLFSTLFQSVYHLMDIAPRRRLLYGRINYLFRLWVTSADNLLDNEDKITLPIRMPGSSRVMRQVVSIMAADRLLTQILDEAIAELNLTPDEANRLSVGSLQVLLPSAAQEASEEGGITERPPPEYVLNTIHRLKTGLLFNLPFLGPDLIENHIAPLRKESLKTALLNFGIACQILDDIRDLARDFKECRHNYILSILHSTQHPYLQRLQERQPDIDARLHLEIPEVTLPAARRAIRDMAQTFRTLSEAGLAIPPAESLALAESFIHVLDLGDLPYAV
jgi:hypothetical protein